MPSGNPSTKKRRESRLSFEDLFRLLVVGPEGLFFETKDVALMRSLSAPRVHWRAQSRLSICLVVSSESSLAEKALKINGPTATATTTTAQHNSLTFAPIQILALFPPRPLSIYYFFFLIALVILCVLGRVTINIGIVQANGRAKKSGDAWARLHPFTWLLPNEWQLMGLEGADSQRGRRCGNIKHCLLLLPFHHPVLSVGCVLALRPSFVNRCGNLCVRSVCVISRRRRRRRR